MVYRVGNDKCQRGEHFTVEEEGGDGEVDERGLFEGSDEGDELELASSRVQELNGLKFVCEQSQAMRFDCER